MHRHSTPSSQLVALLGALVAPWDYDGVDAWRDDIARKARDVVGGHHSRVSLDPACGVTELRSSDIDPAVVDEYLRHWVMRDPFPDMLARRGLTTYVRTATASRFPAFRAQYEASPILNEFYRRIGLHDAAGILHRGSFTAQLTVFTTRRSDARFVARAQRVMPLAAPAFLGGVQQVLGVASIRGQFARSIDTLALPIALYGIDASPVHRTPALTSLLASLPDPAPLEALLDHAARTLSAASRAATGDAAAVTTWRWHDRELSGTVARLGIDGSPPLLMLQLRRAHGGSAVAARGAAGASLTAREREVGRLLARGASNRAIAARLDVSEHTARRHTERILRKLGVTSRARVATALGLVADDDGTAC